MSKLFSQETQLESGPLLISHAQPESQSVALGIFIDVGSRDESPQQAGIAHALEHMLFKGTKKLDVHALSEKLDVLGGNANAFTSRERTCFHLHVLHEDWQEALSLLLDMILEPALPEDEWQREREVIFSEMSMVDDMPDEWVYDQHMKAVFAKQTLGEPTLGKREVLSALTADDLRAYLETYYRPPRMVIVAAGRVEHQALVEQLNQREWPASEASEGRVLGQRSSGIQYLPRDMEQAQVVASFSGMTSNSSQRPVAWLANQMLGGGMSSALFKEVRERRGLAYNVGSHLSTFSDTGLWSVSCGTHPTMLADCLSVLKETLQAFPASIDEALLQRAKRQMEVQFRMGIDAVEGHMLYLGSRLDENELLSQMQWVERVNAVSCDQVQAWAEEMLSSEAMWSIAAPDDALCLARAVM
ncbi:MAG: pitrilysin family protein [Mariprofundaceae bacterium]